MIREHGFLREAHGETPEALGQILGIRTSMVHLLGHLREARDRALCHLVEGHSIEQHMEKIARRGLFRIDVGDVADQLKYIEGNPEWEANVSEISADGRSRTRRGPTTCVELACIGRKEVPADRTCELIAEKHRDQQHEREEEPRAGTLLTLDAGPLRVRTLENVVALLVVRIFRRRETERPPDPLSDEPGDRRHHEEQGQVRETGEGIENQGKEEQQEVLPLISAHEHRTDHEDRQKQRYENQTRKAHIYPLITLDVSIARMLTYESRYYNTDCQVWREKHEKSRFQRRSGPVSTSRCQNHSLPFLRFSAILSMLRALGPTQ